MFYCVHLEIIKPNYFCEFRNYVIIIFINNVNSNLSMLIRLNPAELQPIPSGWIRCEHCNDIQVAPGALQ